MKASLSSDGTLTVSVETELEAYALRAWWAHWECNSLMEGVEGRMQRSCFGVQLDVPQTEAQR